MIAECTLRYCKAYYAAGVKINVPGRLSLLWRYSSSYGVSSSHNAWRLDQKQLDTAFYCGIIYLTIMFSLMGGYHDWSKGYQEYDSTGVRSTQSSSTKRDRRDLQRERFFRPVRHRSGQVRDASSGIGRWMFGDPGSARFWLLSGSILSNKSGLRRGWITRSDSQASGTEACAQAHRRGPRLYRQMPGQRQNPPSPRFGHDDPRAVWLLSTSSQYRTCLGASAKKRALNYGLVDHNTNREEWTSRYEHLRRAALLGRPPDNHSWGMALFVRHGTVGWMRAWPKRDGPAKLTYPPVSLAGDIQTSVPSILREQITILLANMILNGRMEAPLC
jgi:hypothetical protein